MSPFQSRLLWWSSVVTGVTGVAYWWMKNHLEPVDPWAAINHPLQPWVLKAHILAAPVMVFAVGLIAGDHIWRHWRQGVRAGRRSGLLAMWVFVPMVVSGYLIQAVTHVGLLEALVWVHLVTGSAYLVGLVAHHRIFRQALAALSRAPAPGAAGDGSPEGEGAAAALAATAPVRRALRRALKRPAPRRSYIRGLF